MALCPARRGHEYGDETLRPQYWDRTHFRPVERATVLDEMADALRMYLDAMKSKP